MAGEHDHRRLEAGIAHQPDRLASVEIRQADIDDGERDVLALHGRDAALGGVGGDDGELVVEADLFAQTFAKVFVVIDNQDGPLVHLALPLWCPDPLDK